MLKKLIPDFVFQNIEDIEVGFLRGNGIKGVAVDIDNTLAKYSESIPSGEVLRWCGEIKAGGIALCIISNSRRGERAKEIGGAVSCGYIHNAKKPLGKGFVWAAKTMGLPPEEICVIGDQIFTDVLGAKRAGMKACAVYPRGMGENPLFKLRRFLEAPFINRAAKANKK
ncbi:MAG: YqeG family HAD IIIA-type phosphatase [Oscillospiraceae bacterium]|nr:YqeG family HAD IIIA-type phosphatase [Oscillospiraceae bacterium]